MLKLSSITFALIFIVVSGWSATPPIILKAVPTDGSFMKLDEKTLLAVFMDATNHSVTQQLSTDGGNSFLPSPTGEVNWAAKVMRDKSRRLHAVWLVPRGKGHVPAVDRFIDIYYSSSNGSGHPWETARPIYEGYVGAICGRITQLKSGRIILPFALWLPTEPRGFPRGCNASTVVYSDDSGKSWKLSDARLTSPCPKDYNGDGVGAIEPVVLEQNDGRIRMLLRTQADFLYESFSDNGIDWSPAMPSRFHSSTGPSELCRIPDGRVVAFWNNCQLPPRFNGEGVYGGRDALHAAISSDDGKTWKGFREIYLDPNRHQTPPHKGDRGTAYPHYNYVENGRMLVASGQSAKLRVLISLDPDWLEETSRSDDFSQGLENWSVFKPFGAAKGWWRDRVQGGELLEHPAKPGHKLLKLGKPNEKLADGAMWNFPAGQSGTVNIRLQISEGFKGARIELCNRFFDPTDDQGEEMAACTVEVGENYLVNGKIKCAPGKFQTLTIEWNCKTPTATVKLDGNEVGQVPLKGDLINGLSYLRFRSMARDVDKAGFCIESVSAKVTNP